MGLSTFLRSLGAVERQTRGYSAGPSFFDSHPGSRERSAVNAVRAHEMRWRRDPSIGDPRASLLAKINGMPVGQRPESGVVQGSFFIHPDLDFKIHFPSGWRIQNSNMSVGAMSTDAEAIIFLKAEMPPGDPQIMAETWVEKNRENAKITVHSSDPVKVGEIDAWRMHLTIAGARGPSTSTLVTFFPYGEATWSIAGMTRKGFEKQYWGRFLGTARTFTPLAQAERLSFYATKLRVVTALPRESIATLSKRTNNSWSVQDTAINNALFVDHEFEGGELVKISRSEPYIPKSLTE